MAANKAQVIVPSPEDAKAIEELWTRKHEGREVFAQAELLVDCTMRIWNGTHPVEENSREHVVKTGSKILVTVISRFGHVGVRHDRLDVEEHGYYGCVAPEQLRNYRFLSNGGEGWRKALLEKLKNPPGPTRP